MLLLCMTTLSGCFFNDAPEGKDESVFIVERLQDSCEIDSDKLAKILTEDVTAEINCVEAKLNQFAKYVRRSDARYINKSELTRFITKFFPENSDKLNKSIDLLFDISHLILEDKKEVISLTNIQPLVLLFKSFNREALYLHKLLNSNFENDTAEICEAESATSCYESFMIKRTKYKNAIDRLSRYVTNLLRGKKQQIDSLDIISFLKKANKAFKQDPNDDDLIDFDVIENLLFVKRVFLGGDKRNLETDEVHLLLRKLPYFSTLLFDLKYGTKEVFESKPNEQVHLFSNHMDSLKSNVFSNFSAQEIVFTNQDLIDALNSLMSETGDQATGGISTSGVSDMFKDIDFNNFKTVFETLKGKILGGEAQYYTSADIQNILVLTQEVLEGIYFNNLVYDYYQIRMEDPTPISEIVLPTKDELPELAYIREDMIAHYWSIFSHIVKHYHYYGNNEDHIQNFQQEIIRSKYGLNEIYTFRWFSDRLLKAYGSPAPNGEYYGNKEQLEKALISLKPLLVELNFWPEQFETFAFNMITLSDLFQPQSNGDVKMGLDEMTEYFALIVSTVTLHIKVQDEMKRFCAEIPSPDSEDPGKDPIFDPQCYRENFFTVIFDELHLENRLPRLYEYYQSSNHYEQTQYHKYVEEFARDAMTTPDGTIINMYNRDRTLTIGALLNIESLYVTYDSRNINNALTFGELEDAFKIFKNVIIDLGGLDGGKKKYARAVFYFMLDKGREPSNLEVLRYYYFAKFENITGYRKDIGAILSYFKKISVQQAGL